MGLIIDTSVAIASDRRRETTHQFLQYLIDKVGSVPIAFSTISVVELTHGIYRGTSEEVRNQRRLYVESLLRVIPVVSLSVPIARLAGRIEGEQAALGIAIAFQDLVIGATALHLGYGVLTLNLRHFQSIPQLSVQTL